MRHYIAIASSSKGKQKLVRIDASDFHMALEQALTWLKGRGSRLGYEQIQVVNR